MFKKIDKFVFWVRINSIIILALFIFLYGILYGLSYINFDIDTSKIVNYMNIICYIIFFFYPLVAQTSFQSFHRWSG